MASDLHVGVNHLALDEERIRQEQFFEGILRLQERISKVSCRVFDIFRNCNGVFRTPNDNFRIQLTKKDTVKKWKTWRMEFD